VDSKKAGKTKSQLAAATSQATFTIRPSSQEVVFK
jgi:hypothetical protein